MGSPLWFIPGYWPYNDVIKLRPLRGMDSNGHFLYTILFSFKRRALFKFKFKESKFKTRIWNISLLNNGLSVSYILFIFLKFKLNEGQFVDHSASVCQMQLVPIIFNSFSLHKVKYFHVISYPYIWNILSIENI